MYVRIAVVAIGLLALTSVAALAQGFPTGVWEQPGPEMASVASWYGSTGLIITPTALTLPAHKLQGGLHSMEFDVEPQRAWNVNVGVTRNLEVGGARITNVPARPPFSGYQDETIFNAKYKLDLGRWTGVGALTPVVAVGAWDFTDEINRALYVVVSKELELPGPRQARVAAHIGFGKNELEVGPLDGVFGGIELVPMPHALVQIEYDADDINACGRYFVADVLALDVGVVDSDFAWGVTLATPF